MTSAQPFLCPAYLISLYLVSKHCTVACLSAWPKQTQHPPRFRRTASRRRCVPAEERSSQESTSITSSTLVRRLQGVTTNCVEDNRETLFPYAGLSTATGQHPGVPWSCLLMHTGTCLSLAATGSALISHRATRDCAVTGVMGGSKLQVAALCCSKRGLSQAGL